MDYHYKYQKYKQKYNNMSGGLFKFEDSVLKFDFTGHHQLYTPVTQYYYRNESGEIVELKIPNKKLDIIKKQMNSCIKAIQDCKSENNAEERIKKCRGFTVCKQIDSDINTEPNLQIIQYVNIKYEVLYILFVIINEKKFQLYSLDTANRVIIKAKEAKDKADKAVKDKVAADKVKNELLNIIYEKLKSQISQSKPITHEEFLQNLIIDGLADNEQANEQIFPLIDFVYSYIENPTINEKPTIKQLIIKPLDLLLNILTSSTITVNIEEEVVKLKTKLELEIRRQDQTVQFKPVKNKYYKQSNNFNEVATLKSLNYY